MDDEDFATALLRRSRLETLLDLVKLFVTSNEIADRDALEAERDVEPIYQCAPVSVYR
jgi:hypothetical protein